MKEYFYDVTDLQYIYIFFARVDYTNLHFLQLLREFSDV